MTARDEAGALREGALDIMDAGIYVSVICSPLDTPKGLGRGYSFLGGSDAR
jgi:hypothetical protein